MPSTLPQPVAAPGAGADVESDTAHSRREPSAPALPAALPWLVMLAGAGVRLWHYAAGRTLWLDEVKLASNLLRRSYAGLLQPLDDAQGAPVGFLWLEKLAIQGFGNGERALRLVPLLAGLAALPLFWAVARRCLRPWGALLALSAFAALQAPVYFSSEVKQYSTDLAIGLAITLAALNWHGGRPSWRKPIAFGFIGAVGVWLSHPAVFLLAGTALVLIVAAWREHQPRRAAAVAGAAAAGTLSFAAAYVFSLRALSLHPTLHHYWLEVGGFMPPRPDRMAAWLGRTFYSALRDPGGFHFAELAGTLALLGGVALYASCRIALALLLAPLPLLLLASGLQLYPFSDRLILFLVPLFVLLTMAGLGFLDDALRERRRWVATVLGLVLLLPVFGQAALGLRRPYREELRPVLRHVAAHLRPGDRLYVYHGGVTAYLYYRDACGLGGVEPILGSDNRDDWSGYGEDIAEIQARTGGHGRLWVIFSHVCTWKGGDEEQLVLSMLKPLGREVEAIAATGASGHLFELAPPTPPAIAPIAPATWPAPPTTAHATPAEP